MLKVKVAQSCPTLCYSVDYTSMEFSRPGYWNGQLFPSPGGLPNPEIEPRSPALQVDSLTAEPPGKPKNTGEGKDYTLQYSWVSLLAQLVKNSPAIWETLVQSRGWEDPLEKGTHSSILACRILWTVQSMELQRVRHD